jgi:hypothetical protein
MSGPTASDDPTLALWRAAQERKDCQKAEKQERQSRVTELERAFSDVEFGMPEAGDDEQSALAFAARWRHIARLLSKSPDHVHRPLDEIKAEAHSAKAYALRFVTTALANEADAAKLLLNSWQASKDFHSEILYWLTTGLMAELMGRNAEATSSEPLPEQDPSGAEQPPPAITAEAPANPIPVAPTAAGESMEWTTADGPAQWAKMFGVSPTTFKRRLKDGSIRHKKLSTKSYQLAIDDLPAKHQAKFRNVEKPTPK